MKKPMALLYKFLTTFIAAFLAFNLFDHNTIDIIIAVAFVGTIFKYSVGDLFMFPSIGNVLASAIDGVIASVTAYVVDLFTDYFTTTSTGLLIFATIIATAEYFYHIYLLKEHNVTSDEYYKEPPLE